MTPDDPRHGTNAGYVAGCGDQCCRDGAARYQRGLEWDHLQGRMRTVPIVGARRRIEALQVLGWSSEHLSRSLGYSRSWLHVTLTKNRSGRIYRRNFEQIASLYDELSMRLPPETRSTGRQRSLARRKGYLPPLAWNNIDDPTETPTTSDADRPKTDVDPVVILRVMAGDRLPMTRAERVAVVAQMLAAGWSQDRIERHTGITRVDRLIQREAS